MRLIFLECLPDPWNSTYMISYHHDLISSKRPETIPILQAWRMKPREEVGQKPGLADPHHSSSCHATLSPCTSYLLTQCKNERGHNSGSVQFSSVAQLCPTLCDPMNRSTPGLPVHHQLPEFTQTRVHQVGDVIQQSSLSSPSPPAPNPSQHQLRLILGKRQPEPQGWADQRLLEFRDMNEQSPSLLRLPLCHSAAYHRHPDKSFKCIL